MKHNTIELYVSGIRSCYLPRYLEVLAEVGDNTRPHRVSPGRFLAPEGGTLGNALHSAPMGYIARREVGGPREVTVPSAEVKEGHPWYQDYLLFESSQE